LRASRDSGRTSQFSASAALIASGFVQVGFAATIRWLSPDR
jgi:hypothetical protein